MIEARIKLAEAMGWKFYKTCEIFNRDIWKKPDGTHVHDVVGPPIDPFTDANDDYAVLEWWLKSDEHNDQLNFHLHCIYMTRSNYAKADEHICHKIGDYARAACAALNIPLPSQDKDS